MSWKLPSRPAKLRLKTRSAILLIAIIAIGLGGWRHFFSPRQLWRRAIHAPKSERIEYVSIWGRKYDPPRHVFERSVAWPIRNLRIDGLGEKETIEELQRAMSDPDASIREEVYGLVANEPTTLNPSIAVSLLAPGLDDDDEIVRVAAVRGLGRYIRLDRPYPPKFLKMLDDPSPRVRQYAVDATCAAIARVPGTSTPSRDRLIAGVLARLDDPEPWIRAASIEAVEFLFEHDSRLSGAGTGSDEGGAILDALQAKLDDPKPAIRAMAAYVLASHGRGVDTVPMLLEFAKHPIEPLGPIRPLASSWEYQQPVRSLVLLADRSDEAASYLFDQLRVVVMGNAKENWKSSNGNWRRLVEIAGRSPEARARIERLAIQNLETRSPYIRAQLALILQEINSPHDVLPLLIEGVTDDQLYIRREATRALKARCAFDPRVIPRLREAARSPIEYNAGLAAKALKEVESGAAPSAPNARD